MIVRALDVLCVELSWRNQGITCECSFNSATLLLLLNLILPPYPPPEGERVKNALKNVILDSCGRYLKACQFW